MSVHQKSKDNFCNYLGRFFSWVGDRWLLLIAVFLLAFIPLYPKIPLAELIPGYIVRMRLEDIFVLIAFGVWLIQIVRKKIAFRSVSSILILSYLLIGLLSILSATIFTHTIPWQTLHMGKSFLHLLRYFEYFVLFFVTFSSIKKVDDLKLVVGTIILTLFLVVVYGYGQRFFYWPVFSTMNREFSKGIRLYLTEHARVQSTFGGHYDLGAYLVIVLNLVLAIALSTKSKLLKIATHLIHTLGLWLLVVSASRISFIAYLGGSMLVIAITALQSASKIKGWKFFISRSFGQFILVTFIMISFGQDMKDRLFHVVQQYPKVEQSYQQIEDVVISTYKNALVFIGITDSNPPQDDSWVAVTQQDQQPLANTDQLPSTTKPIDVYTDVPDKVKVATESASGSIEYIIVEKERTWSDNAMKYGLSAAIRLDTLWPNAIRGFKHNPIFGTGYATLNKESPFHFTEAESTDNNFLRILGETGLLGFISFFAIIIINVWQAIRLLHSNSLTGQKNSLLIQSFVIGFLGATAGMLINALYIDVFASSKVAFTYWALSGALVALSYNSLRTADKKKWPFKLELEITRWFSSKWRR